MTMRPTLYTVLFTSLFASLLAAGCAPAAAPGAAPAPAEAPIPEDPPVPAGWDPGPEAPTSPEDRKLLREAARSAWAFVERNYQPRTGLVKAHDDYRFVTTWDIASGLAALYAAREMEMLPEAEYERRMRRALRTLREMPLSSGVAFNRAYDATTGEPVDRETKPTQVGTGWSTTDLGRLLLWLRIIATNHPQFADDASAVVRRLDYDRLIRDDYLQGGDIPPGDSTPNTYPEGRIGYEQYAAQGFAAWGHRAPGALSLARNTKPIEVMGVPLRGDTRGRDRLTSEPFVMMGLEQGWVSPAWKELARAVLAAQEARWKKTGQVTMVSEDAVPVPPYYFYYYNVYHEGKEFPVSYHGHPHLDSPRWVSSKASYGWHALFPGDYTRRAVRVVAPAINRKGVDAGVFEGTGKATGGGNVNTAALIMEAALYAERGRPLMSR